MPAPKSISTKTITLVIGIIVALILFLNATLFDQNKKGEEQLSQEPAAKTSQTLIIINKGATNILSLIKKFK